MTPSPLSLRIINCHRSSLRHRPPSTERPGTTKPSRSLHRSEVQRRLFLPSSSSVITSPEELLKAVHTPVQPRLESTSSSNTFSVGAEREFDDAEALSLDVNWDVVMTSTTTGENRWVLRRLFLMALMASAAAAAVAFGYGNEQGMDGLDWFQHWVSEKRTCIAQGSVSSLAETVLLWWSLKRQFSFYCLAFNAEGSGGKGGSTRSFLGHYCPISALQTACSRGQKYCPVGVTIHLFRRHQSLPTTVECIWAKVDCST